MQKYEVIGVLGEMEDSWVFETLGEMAEFLGMAMQTVAFKLVAIRAIPRNNSLD